MGEIATIIRLRQGFINFYCKGLDHILSLTGYTFCLKYSILPLELESSHTKYVNELAYFNEVLVAKHVLDWVCFLGHSLTSELENEDLNAVFLVCFQLY